MKRKISSDVLVVLLLVFFLCIFFFPILSTKRIFVTNGMIFSDLLTQNYPFKFIYAQLLKKGGLPFWVARMGDGFPLLAEGQVGAFYPLNLLLFLLFTPLLAFNLSLVLNYFLAGLFTFLLGRYHLRLSSTSALMAGLTFSLSGFMILHLAHVSMIQTAIWLPLQLWLLEEVLKKPKFWQAIPLGLVFACQFLAGHGEIFYFSALFLGVYIVIRLFGSQKDKMVGRSLMVLVMGAGLTILFCLPQLWETFQLTKVSNRAEGLSFERATSVPFPLRHLLTFIFPRMYDFIKESALPRTDQMPLFLFLKPRPALWETYLYVGLAPFFLALLAVIYGLIRDKRIRLFSAWLVFSLLLAFGSSTPLFGLLWKLVPGMKLFQYPTRFLVFTQFCIAVLAGIGLEHLLEIFRRIKTRFDFSLIVAFFIIIITFFDLFSVQRRINPVGNTSEWLEPPETAKFLQENLGDYRFYTLGTLSIDYETLGDLEAQRGLRELLPGDLNLLFNLSSTSEQSAIFLNRYLKLLNEAPGARLGFNESGSLVVSNNFIRALSLKGTKYLLSALPLVNEHLTLVKDVPLLKEVDYIIPQVKGDQVEIKRVPTETVYVYENQQVLPRTWLVFEVQDLSRSREEKILETVVSEDFDPRREVILEEKFSGELSGEGEGEAEIISYEDEQVKITVDSRGNGFLILTDNFYPTWKAYVDGEETKIYLANFSFRAVPITSGSHIVEFKYTPWSFDR